VTPFFVLVLADGLYLSFGVLKVVLYRHTRPYLLPHRMDSLDNQSFVLRSELADSKLTSRALMLSAMTITHLK
jgi:hypothetical protein